MANDYWAEELRKMRLAFEKAQEDERQRVRNERLKREWQAKVRGGKV